VLTDAAGQVVWHESPPEVLHDGNSTQQQDAGQDAWHWHNCRDMNMNNMSQWREGQPAEL
jgi:hypothetical protein